jgi:DNA repair protein RecN (Recombination protein N)
LKSIEKFDEAIKGINKEVKDIYYLTEVLIEKMENYYNNIEYDEYRLNDINSRISDINMVMKKYGNSYNVLMEYKESLNKKLNEYNSIEEKIINLEKNNLILLDQYNLISTDITKIRFEFAEIFEKRIKEEFNELNMKNSNIKVSISEKDNVSKNGKDNVELLISTNLGQPFRPLKEIVSGGELSRTMLGIKLITKEINDIPTLIFDEVDTGISGLTANIIGKKLKSISKDLQVITITHLPQIAAFANNHISVVKSIDKLKNVTISKVMILDDKGKIDEIAKLISGKNITNSSIKSANELIQKSM